MAGWTAGAWRFLPALFQPTAVLQARQNGVERARLEPGLLQYVVTMMPGWPPPQEHR